MRNTILIIVLLSIGSLQAIAQLNSIKELKEADQLDLSLYFYPSTLRMINIDQDTALNKLVKGVRKASFHQLNPESFDANSFYQLKNTIAQEEDYEEYLTMEGGPNENGQGFQIIGNEKGDEWVAMAFIDGQGYLISLAGTINWLQAPKVYQALLEKSENTESGFGILLNYLKSESDRSKKKREWKKNRQNKKKEEKASVEVKVEF